MRKKIMKVTETMAIETVKSINGDNLSTFQEATKKEGLPEKIVTVVEAIHTGLTKNNTFYPSDNLRNSAHTWNTPYAKPVIKNHDVSEEPMGRVLDATFKESQLAADKQTIELTLELTDPGAISKVLDGRYQTVSIGGSTNSATCSICGKNLVSEGYCGHMKGRMYDGQKAYWTIGEMEFDEISFVNVPADANAQVIHKDKAKQEESASDEGGNNMKTKKDDETQAAESILDQVDTIRIAASQEENLEDTSEIVEEEEQETSTDATEEETEGETTEETTEEDAEDSDGDDESTEESNETTEEVSKDDLIKKVAELEGQIDTLTSEKATLTDQHQTISTERDSLTDQVETLEKDLATVKEDLTIADSENKTLTKQNINLATYTHKTLVESVANLRIVLGKAEEEKRDELMATLTKEASRNLRQEITTLVKERPQRIVQKVDNPGVVLNDGTHGVDDDGITESTHQELQTKDIEYLANRMSTAFNRKHQN